MAHLSYSIEEAREILLDRTIPLWAHIYLEGRLKEYVRAEDHGRPTILQSCFRYIWSSTRADWDWDQQPPDDIKTEYYAQRDAVYHWFRANARIRGGFKRLPKDVEKTNWTAEDVCGTVYKKAILEWVEAKSGFVPGHADGFLAQYRSARSRLFRCLSADQLQACERTAEEWNGAAVPHHIQVQNFNNKFASVCRAFTNMLLKDYGVCPFIFYVGVPGHNVPPGVYEMMRKEGLAAQTFRSFSRLDSVFNDMRSYVNMNVDTLYRAEAKRPPPMRSAEHLKAAEYEFRRADIVGQRVQLFAERLREGWEENSAHLFYQIVQFCHSAITNSKQIPPPWKALSLDPTKLIVPECLPQEGVQFGISPEKTHTEDRNKLLKLWFRIGYLEFHHSSARGKLAAPTSERWYELGKYDSAFMEQWRSNERSVKGPAHIADGIDAVTDATVKFGSNGPRVYLGGESIYHLWMTPEQNEPLESRLPDPDDRLGGSRPSYHAGQPSWPAPCLVPNTNYARLQWSDQFLSETGGKAADTLLDAVKWLVQLPPVANYDYDITYFCKQEGKTRSWTVDTLPGWVTWNLDRSYLQSQAEVDALSAFLEARAWTFQHEGKTRFAGIQMAWTIVLAASLYIRAIRHAEEAIANPPSRWSVSGSPDWPRRAREYSFPLDNDGVRVIMHDLQCYLEDLANSMPVAGLPPSLLYCCHSSREQYVRLVLESIPELAEMLPFVMAMPATGVREYPSLPFFASRRVWQEPQLGLPRAAHKETWGKEALLMAVRNPLLFLNADGSTRASEAGLSALLELALFWAELDRVSADDRLPVYVRSSKLLEQLGVDSLQRELSSAVVGHQQVLARATSRSGGSRRRASSREVGHTSIDTAGAAHLGPHLVDIDADLRAFQKDTQADPLRSRIRDSAVQGKEKQDRWKMNELERRSQNAINLAAHATIHPAKPRHPPLVLPDLSQVHEELQYIPGQAPGFAPSTVSGKRTKRTPRHDVQRSSHLQTDTSDDALMYGDTSASLGGCSVGQITSLIEVNARKRSAEREPALPPSKRSRVRWAASVPDHSDDLESFDLEGITSGEEDLDTTLPVTLSRPHAAIASNMATRSTDLLAERRDKSDCSTNNIKVTESAEIAQDATENVVARTESHGPTTRPPRPRPRKRDPNNQTGRPGYSTAF